MDEDKVEDDDLDPEQGNADPFVPKELIEVHEINEWRVANGLLPLEAPK